MVGNSVVKFALATGVWVALAMPSGDPAMIVTVEAVIARNLVLEGFSKDDNRFQARLANLALSEEDGIMSGTYGGLTHFAGRADSQRLESLTYRRELKPEEWLQTPRLDKRQCEDRAREFAGLLRFPSEVDLVSVEMSDRSATAGFKFPLVLGHRVDSVFTVSLNRHGGVLEWAEAGRVYDLASLKQPRISAEQAASVGLSEYQRAGMFTITQISDPILMAGRPMTTDEYRDRVSLDRLNQFKGDKPVAFWRVGFQESDGAKLAGTIHIVDIDTQTGEIVGQARMSQLGGGSEPPVISWSKIGKVGVVGDRSKASGTIEALTTQELPGGKPVAVQAGKLIYACRYDVKKNILWRRLPEGKYEPGRPAASLVKALKAQAR